MNGIDVLGLAMMDIPMLVAEWPNKYALGALMGTFGDIEPGIRAILSTKRCPAVRIHLTNGPCARNRQCQPNEPKDIKKAIRSRAAKVESWAIDFPSTRFYICPRLESDETDMQEVMGWFRDLDHIAPHCTSVSSVLHGWHWRRIIQERHGNDARAKIVSNDGESLYDVGPAYRGRGSLITFGWLPRCNLRLTPTFVPPRKRDRKDGLRKGDIRYIHDTLG